MKDQIKTLINDIASKYNIEDSTRIQLFLSRYCGLLTTLLSEQKNPNNHVDIMIETLSCKWNFDRDVFIQNLIEYYQTPEQDIVSEKEQNWLSELVNNSEFKKKPEKCARNILKKYGDKAKDDSVLIRGLPLVFFRMLHSTITHCKTTHIDPLCVASCHIIKNLFNYILRNKNGIISLNNDKICRKFINPGLVYMRFKKHKEEFAKYLDIMMDASIDDIPARLYPKESDETSASNTEQNNILKTMAIGIWTIRKMRQVLIENPDANLSEITVDIPAENARLLSRAIINCYSQNILDVSEKNYMLIKQLLV